jgi:hypothetical protein
MLSSSGYYDNGEYLLLENFSRRMCTYVVHCFYRAGGFRQRASCLSTRGYLCLCSKSVDLANRILFKLKNFVDYMDDVQYQKIDYFC